MRHVTELMISEDCPRTRNLVNGNQLPVKFNHPNGYRPVGTRNAGVESPEWTIGQFGPHNIVLTWHAAENLVLISAREYFDSHFFL